MSARRWTWMLVAVGSATCAGQIAAEEAVGARLLGLEYRALMQSSGIPEEAQFIVTDEEHWHRLWGRIVAPRRPAPPPPTIDFTRESVIVAAAGRRTTGGTRLSLQVSASGATALLAHVLVTDPGRGCIVPQVLSAPVEILIVSRPRAVVRFDTERRVQDCAAR